MSKPHKRPIHPKVNTLNNLMARRRGIRDLPRRFLIVCEDEQSARNYFNALRKYENLSAASIAVVSSNGRTQPIQVVDEAISRTVRAADSNSATEPFDETWCIIDGDFGSAINNARRRAEANGVKLAISTQCFEYWILLHFAESAVPSPNCDAVVSSLKRDHYAGYSKGKCDFSNIVSNAREAMARARRLRRKDELPENQNPCSDVYLLIEAILDNYSSHSPGTGGVTPTVR